MNDTTTTIYQIKITMEEIRPLIWRRILVPAHITLPKLHRIIQQVMPWLGYHLHVFEVDEERYGVPDSDYPELITQNEKRMRLCDIAPSVSSAIQYEYDFGDSWRHLLVVEKILPQDEKITYPVCIGGQRACPPEDCGGVGGYDNFVKAIADPDNEEHDDCLRWIGGFFDPEGFDPNAVNEKLRKIRQ